MRTARSGLAVTALLIVLAGCSGGSGSTPGTASATPAATSAATPVTTPAPSTAAGRVSANTASQAELVAALEAAGVANASRWAREIEEYRPYPADDPTLAKLADELAKYNPDAATLEAILGALEP